MRTQLSQPLAHHTIDIDPAIAKITYQYHRIVIIVIAALSAVPAMTTTVIPHIAGIQESASRCGYPPR